MPPIYSQSRRKPHLFAKVFKVINGIKGKQGITVHRVAGEVHAKLEQLGLTPNAKRVLIQVRRALKFGVKNKLLLLKQGRYHLTSPNNNYLTDDSLDLYSFCSKHKLPFKKTKNSPLKQKGTQKYKKLKSGYHNPSISSHNSSRQRYIRRKNFNHETRRSYMRTSESIVSNHEIDKKTISYEAIRPASYQELNNEDPSNSVIYNNTNDQFECSACAFDRKSVYTNDGVEVIKPLSDRPNKATKPLPDRPNKVTKPVPPTEDIKSKKKTHLKKRKKRDRCLVEPSLRNDGNNIMANMSTSTAIAAAIMIIMSLWYGYR